MEISNIEGNKDVDDPARQAPPWAPPSPVNQASRRTDGGINHTAPAALALDLLDPHH